ncbi:interaptin-like [Haliotis rubra]|uniref:interaptin-like n=1 Tax=Haliotis rubra TaxID=36100 RepID=UPI001EE5EBF3|nr:interaptin-like [Haliotis rubra]
MKKKATLKKFHNVLVEGIILSETFLGEFIEQGILDLDLKEEITCEATVQAKNAKFLSVLPRRGPNAFPTLLRVLEGQAPWIREELETFYNKQRRIVYTREGDFVSDDNTNIQPSYDPPSRSQSTSVLEKAVQTLEDFHNEEDVNDIKHLRLTIEHIHLRLVTYLHSQGIREFNIVESNVTSELLDRVAKEMLNVVSNKDNILSSISSQFSETEKQHAENDVSSMVKNVLSDKASLKQYLDNKDLEVMKSEKESNERIENLEDELRHLNEKVEEKQLQVQALEEQLQGKEREIQKLEEAATLQLQEPLSKRIHSLIDDVLAVKSQKEKQMYQTEQEFQDLQKDTNGLENLLNQLKSVHYHAEQQHRRHEQYQSVHERTNDKNISRDGKVYQGIVSSEQTSTFDSRFDFDMSANNNERSYQTKLSRSPRRRLKRSPRPANMLVNRSNSDTVPTSPKQKTPRYQQPLISRQISELHLDNQSISRQSTDFCRSVSRQGTDLSRSTSRQTTNISLKSNTMSMLCPSRQSTDLSLMNGHQSRTSSRSEDPLASARQTPRDSPQLHYKTRPGSVRPSPRQTRSLFQTRKTYRPLYMR